jgi:hypothetical protein
MKHLVRLGLAGWVTLLTFALVGGVGAAGPPATCTAGLVIFTTSPGTVTTTGVVTHFRDSGVGGQYTAGFLAGYTFSGSQDIQRNNRTQQAELHGAYVASGPGGRLTVRYTGHADLLTGAATGHFVAGPGTGDFTQFHWAGDITAQLVSAAPPTFLATDSGPCH